MRVAWGIAGILLTVAGCNSQQLRFTTLRLGESIPDLQERQVIDNLARIAARPGTLPYYTVISAGTANIQDTGSGGLAALSLQHKVYPLGTGTATASRAVTGNWTLNPMSNPDRLRAMRAAYHIALGGEAVDPFDQAKLDAILKDQGDPRVNQGWLCIGDRHDVPREARIVSHYAKTYVWVMPQNEKQFADFALTMLNIATWTAPAPTPKMNVAIVEGAFGKQPDTTMPAPLAPVGSQALPPRLYEDSQTINRGLFFIPR